MCPYQIFFFLRSRSMTCFTAYTPAFSEGDIHYICRMCQVWILAFWTYYYVTLTFSLCREKYILNTTYYCRFGRYVCMKEYIECQRPIAILLLKWYCKLLTTIKFSKICSMHINVNIIWPLPSTKGVFFILWQSPTTYYYKQLKQ